MRDCTEILFGAAYACLRRDWSTKSSFRQHPPSHYASIQTVYRLLSVAELSRLLLLKCRTHFPTISSQQSASLSTHSGVIWNISVSSLLYSLIQSSSTKLKYLGCIFLDGSCEIDISPSVGKFYAQFNNIMAVLGKYNNEMAAVHLTNSYCVPSLLYACEIWSLRK